MLPLYLFKQLKDSHGPHWQPYCKPVHAVILQGNTLISDNPEECAGRPSRNTKSIGSSPETQSPCWPTVSVKLSRASALTAVGSEQGFENCFEPPGARTTPGCYRLLGSLGPQSPLCCLAFHNQKLPVPGSWQRKRTNLRTSFLMIALPIHRPILLCPAK